MPDSKLPEFLPYGCPTVEPEDELALRDALYSGWLATGPKVTEFEECFAEVAGAQYAVSFSSGTGALHIAALAAGADGECEGITTPLTFSATANCLVYCGAMPHFVDVDPATLTLDSTLLEAALTDRTKFILPVDYAGQPADMDPIMELAEARDITVIQDCCHSPGGGYKGRPAGSVAHMSVFSFHPVKHMTTGEGGMVTTDDPALADRLRKLRNHGIDRSPAERSAVGEWSYDIVELGYNYRLSDVGAALGLSQLSRLKANLERRRLVADAYREKLADSPLVALPEVGDYADHAYHLFVVRLCEELTGERKRALFAKLLERNVGVNVHYPPVHLLTYYRERFGYKPGDYPHAETAFEELLSLPMHHGMSHEDGAKVALILLETATELLAEGGR